MKDKHSKSHPGNIFITVVAIFAVILIFWSLVIAGMIAVTLWLTSKL